MHLLLRLSSDYEVVEAMGTYLLFLDKLKFVVFIQQITKIIAKNLRIRRLVVDCKFPNNLLAAFNSRIYLRPGFDCMSICSTCCMQLSDSNIARRMQTPQKFLDFALCWTLIGMGSCDVFLRREAEMQLG